MRREVNTEISGKSSKTVPGRPGRPRRASKANAVQPRNRQRRQGMTIKSARKSDAVERTVAHDEDIREERKQLRMNLAEAWRTRDNGGINTVNPDMPRIEPFGRINEGLPGGNDNPGSNADKPDLTNTGAISIRGLNIKRNERRKRSSTRHRKEILTIRGQERAREHEDRRSETQQEPGLPPRRAGQTHQPARAQGTRGANARLQ